jgi:pyruvate formate lyase activating enzyme
LGVIFSRFHPGRKCVVAFSPGEGYNKGVVSLADLLAARTRDAYLYDRYDGTWVRCHACGHECPIPEGAAGVCRVRFNRGGTLMAPWGYVAGAQADPIEKKPFFHVLPGSVAFSIGMLGCDFHCAYCQNWLSSQVLRDAAAQPGFTDTSPDSLVRLAARDGAASVVSTYNEPLITAEWASEIFTHARQASMATGMVSNGHGTRAVLNFLRPNLDFFKVDLKCFDDTKYRTLGGRLQPVLDTIQGLKDRGVWVEVVSLIVPGFNDGDDELRWTAGFLAEVSPDIPWHVTGYYPQYRMDDRPPTSPASLQHAAAIGLRAGLRFVYAGNLPGQVGALEDTRCPECQRTVVKRHGYQVEIVGLTHGQCAGCGFALPGLWHVSR